MANKRKLCFYCKGHVVPHRSQPTETLFNRSGSTAGTSQESCSWCHAEVDLISSSVRVSGANAEEVKLVASCLVSQVHEIKQHSENTHTPSNLSLKSNNNHMKHLISVTTVGLGIFFAISYVMINFAASPVQGGKFSAIMICLPILFILVSTFVLVAIGVLTKENFMELVMRIIGLLDKLISFVSNFGKGGHNENDDERGDL